jgi:hypothetical protein
MENCKGRQKNQTEKTLFIDPIDGKIQLYITREGRATTPNSVLVSRE